MKQFRTENKIVRYFNEIIQRQERLKLRNFFEEAFYEWGLSGLSGVILADRLFRCKTLKGIVKHLNKKNEEIKKALLYYFNILF